MNSESLVSIDHIAFKRKFQDLAKRLAQTPRDSNEGSSEAQTRHEIIDETLKLLNWDGYYRVEAHRKFKGHDRYMDYLVYDRRLEHHPTTPLAVVEAKSEKDYYRKEKWKILEGRTEVSLNEICINEKELAEIIDKLLNVYVSSLNPLPKLAAISDGHRWLIFTGDKLQAVLNGKPAIARVFSSHLDILSRSEEFYQLLERRKLQGKAYEYYDAEIFAAIADEFPEAPIIFIPSVIITRQTHPVPYAEVYKWSIGVGLWVGTANSGMFRYKDYGMKTTDFVTVSGDEFANRLPDLHKQYQHIVKQARLEIDQALKKKERRWIKRGMIDCYQRKTPNILFPEGNKPILRPDVPAGGEISLPCWEFCGVEDNFFTPINVECKNCPYHHQTKESSHVPAMPTIEDRRFFPDGSIHFCSNQEIFQSKAVTSKPVLKAVTSIPLQRVGNYFCEFFELDQFLCCRTCTLHDVCNHDGKLDSFCPQ